MSKLPSVSLSGTYFFKSKCIFFFTIRFSVLYCQIKTDLFERIDRFLFDFYS
jgi:hypothetical protein